MRSNRSTQTILTHFEAVIRDTRHENEALPFYYSFLFSPDNTPHDWLNEAMDSAVSWNLAGSRPLSSRHWTQLLLLKAGNWPAIQFPRFLSSYNILDLHSSLPTPSTSLIPIPSSSLFFAFFASSCVASQCSSFWYWLPPSPSQVWTSFVGQSRVKWSAREATEREQASSPTLCFYLARTKKGKTDWGEHRGKRRLRNTRGNYKGKGKRSKIHFKASFPVRWCFCPTHSFLCITVRSGYNTLYMFFFLILHPSLVMWSSWIHMLLFTG